MTKIPCRATLHPHDLNAVKVYPLPRANILLTYLSRTQYPISFSITCLYPISLSKSVKISSFLISHEDILFPYQIREDILFPNLISEDILFSNISSIS